MNCPPLKAADGGVRCSLGGPELSETTTGQRRDVRDSGATVVLDDSRHFHSAPRNIVMFMRRQRSRILHFWHAMNPTHR